MKALLLIFLLACGHVVTAQDSKAAQAFVGCYELEVEGWQRLLGSDVPRRFELKEDFEAKDLDTKQRWGFASFWNVKNGKTEILWSTGFVGWHLLLSKSGTDLRGTADCFTDFGFHSHRTVVAHPVDCKALARRSQLDWLLSPRTPWPLFWILMVLGLALFFAARRLKNKRLRSILVF